MALSDITKRVLNEQRGAKARALVSINKDIDELKAELVKLEAEAKTTKAELDALNKDVGVPTPPKRR